MTGVDDLTAAYRLSRGWNPDPDPTSRISLELPRELIRQLNRHARLLRISRRQIIEAAITGLLSEFDQIDREEGA